MSLQIGAAEEGGKVIPLPKSQRVTVRRSEQICVAVPGTLLAQLDALSVACGNPTRWCLDHLVLRYRLRLGFWQIHRGRKIVVDFNAR
jgi:hypothetical protein